jgi:hypothetical protein
MQRIVGGFVSISDGRPVFIASDGRILPLRMLSSGTLELLPVFNVLNRTAYEQEHRSARVSAMRIPPIADISYHNPRIYLEEPEAEVFPATQDDLVRLFACLSKDAELDFSWVITTHSPYILSVFGDLAKAGKVGAENPQNHAAVSRVIPEKYWIKDGDFAAYKIDDGKLVSIYDEKTGQIDGDYLDNVSGKISDEFGRLLEIQYGK